MNKDNMRVLRSCKFILFILFYLSSCMCYAIRLTACLYIVDLVACTLAALKGVHGNTNPNQRVSTVAGSVSPCEPHGGAGILLNDVGKKKKRKAPTGSRISGSNEMGEPARVSNSKKYPRKVAIQETKIPPANAGSPSKSTRIVNSKRYPRKVARKEESKIQHNFMTNLKVIDSSTTSQHVGFLFSSDVASNVIGTSSTTQTSNKLEPGDTVKEAQTLDILGSEVISHSIGTCISSSTNQPAGEVISNRIGAATSNPHGHAGILLLSDVASNAIDPSCTIPTDQPDTHGTTGSVLLTDVHSLASTIITTCSDPEEHQVVMSATDQPDIVNHMSDTQQGSSLPPDIPCHASPLVLSDNLSPDTDTDSTITISIDTKENGEDLLEHDQPVLPIANERNQSKSLVSGLNANDYSVDPFWQSFYRYCPLFMLGRKKGCVRCSELVLHGQSSAKHMFGCPSRTTHLLNESLAASSFDTQDEYLPKLTLSNVILSTVNTDIPCSQDGTVIPCPQDDFIIHDTPDFDEMITTMYTNSELSSGFGGFGVIQDVPEYDLFYDDTEDKQCIELPVMMNDKEQLQGFSLTNIIKV